MTHGILTTPFSPTGAGTTLSADFLYVPDGTVQQLLEGELSEFWIIIDGSNILSFNLIDTVTIDGVAATSGVTVIPEGFHTIAGVLDASADIELLAASDAYNYVPMVLTANIEAPANGFIVETVTGFNYNFTIDWGDGSQIDTITAWDDPLRIHTYTNIGVYDITLTGLIERLQYGGSIVDFRLVDVKHFGRTRLVNCYEMFYGCDVCVFTAVPECDTSTVIDFTRMFRDCSVGNPDVSQFDTSSSTQMVDMFMDAVSATPDVTGFDTSNCGSFHSMFLGATNANPDISGFNISSLGGATNMLSGSAFSNANYDAALVAWAAQSPAITDEVTWSVGTAQYTESAARAVLATTHSWAIFDGGAV